MNRLIENKYFFWAMTAFIAAFFSWCIWVTDNIYAQRTTDAAEKQTIKQACETVQEIKQQNEKLKAQLETHRDRNAAEQQEMMKILLDIQKQVNKSNNKK